MRANTVPIGEFSSGTMLPEDVGGAIADLLRPLRLSRADRQTVREWDRTVENWSADLAAEDRKMADLCRDLWNALDSYLPPYTYAGPSEGDGALFGVWPSLDAYIPKYPAGYSPNGVGDCYEVTDHGNVSCGCRRRNGTWVEYWSVA